MKNIQKYLTGIILLSAIAVASCGKKPASESVSEAKADSVNSSEFCYASALKQDTITLHANLIDGKINGDLIYNLFEKDRNKGTISGDIKGDTLLAKYTFMSEGKESVREVIFLKKDSLLLEGYGNMKESDGQFVFENPAEIKFGNGIVLRKVECP